MDALGSLGSAWTPEAVAQALVLLKTELRFGGIGLAIVVLLGIGLKCGTISFHFGRRQ